MLSRGKVSFVVVLLCALAGSGGVASGQVAHGSPLTSPANYPYGCETRWLPGFPPASEFQPTVIGPSTCSMFQAGTTIDNTHLVPGPGTVTTARVKSGPNPAKLSIATVRRYFKPNSQGVMEYTCCQGISETPPFDPTPNAVTEVPVNLLVSTQQPENGQTGWWDIVVVSALGPGTLPMSDLGSHPNLPGAGVLNTTWAYPKLAPNDNHPAGWDAPGFEVLMQYSWCPSTGGRAALRACPTKPPTTPTNPTNPTNPAEISSPRLSLIGLSVKVLVKCAQATDCKGKVKLSTVAKKPVVLGSKTITVRSGKSLAVAVPVSARNRKRITKKGLKVKAEIDLGKGTAKITRTLTLKRTG
jgi:hypothetical protein